MPQGEDSKFSTVTIVCAFSTGIKHRLQTLLQVSRQTIGKYADSQTLTFSGKIVTLPATIILQLIEELADFPTYKEKNSVFKVFCYMWLGCGSFDGFTKTQRTMAKELHIDLSDFNGRLKWLIEHK